MTHQYLYWSPESPLKVPCRSRTLGPLGDVPVTLCVGWDRAEIFPLAAIRLCLKPVKISPWKTRKAFAKLLPSLYWKFGTCSQLGRLFPLVTKITKIKQIQPGKIMWMWNQCDQRVYVLQQCYKKQKTHRLLDKFSYSLNT